MSGRPVLRGVVFDMDGTLTIPNLDFKEMYGRCGVDNSKDILEEVAAMPKDQQLAANRIIEEMEAEGRRTLELMPGADEVLRWLASHQIPTALVTRNTRESANVLTGRLLSSSCKFSAIIARDDGYPPKPDPTALEAIAEQWEISLPSDCILMVGDSVSNDIAFGRNAGVKTVLLDTGRRYQEAASGKGEQAVPDIIVDDLGSLPSLLLPKFEIQSLE